MSLTTKADNKKRMEKHGFAQSVSKQVIELAQKGDRAAFETIYQTYAKACFNLAFRICRDRLMAEDIVQTSFIKVIKKIQQFNHQGAFAGWLKRIVSNESINRIRVDSRMVLVEDENALLVEQDSLFESNWMVTVHELNGLLQSLSETARAVLLLHEVEGYNHKEIADMFGKSESFSKVTLSRAYKHLRSLVDESSDGKKNALN